MSETTEEQRQRFAKADAEFKSKIPSTDQVDDLQKEIAALKAKIEKAKYILSARTNATLNTRCMDAIEALEDTSE